MVLQLCPGETSPAKQETELFLPNAEQLLLDTKLLYLENYSHLRSSLGFSAAEGRAGAGGGEGEGASPPPHREHVTQPLERCYYQRLKLCSTCQSMSLWMSETGNSLSTRLHPNTAASSLVGFLQPQHQAIHPHVGGRDRRLFLGKMWIIYQSSGEATNGLDWWGERLLEGAPIQMFLQKPAAKISLSPAVTFAL